MGLADITVANAPRKRRKHKRKKPVKNIAGILGSTVTSVGKTAKRTSAAPWMRNRPGPSPRKQRQRVRAVRRVIPNLTPTPISTPYVPRSGSYASPGVASTGTGLDALAALLTPDDFERPDTTPGLPDLGPADYALNITPFGRIGGTLGTIGKAVGIGGKAAPKAKRVADSIRLAEKAAAKAAPKGTRAKGVVKSQVKKRKTISAKEAAKAAKTKEGRRGLLGPRAQRYADLGLKIGGPGAAVAAVGGERYLTALADDPGETLKTTAQSIPAMGTALVAAPINAAVAVAEGDTDALKKFIEQQKDYYEMVANISNPGFSDEEARRLIQEDVGLIPPIATALGAGALAKYGMPRPTPSVGIPLVGRGARLNRAYRDRQSPDRGTRAKAEKKIQKAKPGSAEDRRQRVEESKRQAVTADRVERQLERELRTTGKGKKRIDARMVELLDNRVTDDVTVGDTVQLIGRESLRGMDENAVLRKLDAIEAKMVDPRRELSDTTVHTRQVIAALRENPDLPSDPDMLELIDGLAVLQRGRSTERHEESSGERQTTPDPDDVGPQLLHVAQTEGIPTASQRMPMELRSAPEPPTGVRYHEVKAPAKKNGTLDDRVAILWFPSRKDSDAVNADDFQWGNRDLFVSPRGWTHTDLEKHLNQKGLIDSRGLTAPERGNIEGGRFIWQDADSPDGREFAEAEIQKRFPGVQIGKRIARGAGKERYGHAQGILDKLNEQKRKQLAGEAPVPVLRTGREVRPVSRRRVAPLSQKSNKDADVRLRARAKRMQRRARKEMAIAEQMRKDGRPEADRFEARAQSLMAGAENILRVVDRERRAEALERRATAIERGAKPREDEPTPDVMRQMAQAMRAEDVESKRALNEEFAGDVKTQLKREGREEPVFFKASDAADRGAMQGQNEYRGANLAKREKRLMGTLAKQGRIDEAGGVLLENIARGRYEIEIKKHTRQFAKDRTIKNEDGSMRIVTGPEARQLLNDGEVPPGTSLFPIQELSAAFQRGAWDEAAGLITNESMKSLRQMRGEKGKKYAMVPDPALREFHAQMEGYGAVLSKLRYLGRAQSLMLLATSPAWFSWQLAASPMTALYSHPNPVRWANASKKALTDWRKLDERERIDFQVEYGGTVADAIDFQDRRIGMDADAVRSADSAINTAKRAPGYKAMAAVGNNLKKGGPFIQFNRRYEAEYRDLVALIQMDKEVNPSRVLKFVDSIYNTHRFVEQDVAHLKGKPLAEQVRYYNDNPEAARRLANKVDDAMGNWNAMTAKERNIQALTVFFPFLRFSTRWLLKTYPRDNPLRAAFLANLAAANVVEYEKLLGEEPSFFPDFGNVVIQSAEPTAVNMSRVAPGSNALVESLGGGELNLQTALRPFQPIAGIGASALAGQNPITGLPLPEGMSKGESFAKGVVGLNPLLRAEANKIGPEPSVYSDLFRRITGREGDLEQYAVPRIETDLPKERIAARASVLMDLVFGENTPTEVRTAARAELYGLMREYGLTPPGEEPSSSSSSSSAVGTAPWMGGSSSSSSSSSTSTSTAPWMTP